MRGGLLCPVLLAGALAACGSESDTEQFGADPHLPEQQSKLLPAMEIAEPAAWAGAMPKILPGFTIVPVATGLKIPRQILGGRGVCRRAWQLEPA